MVFFCSATFYLHKNVHGFKGQAWETEPWERGIMYNSVYRQNYFTDRWDKATEPAWLNRAQSFKLKEETHFGVRIFFSVIVGRGWKVWPWTEDNDIGWDPSVYNFPWAQHQSTCEAARTQADSCSVLGLRGQGTGMVEARENGDYRGNMWKEEAPKGGL